MPESPFYKVAGLGPATLSKKRLWHRSFLVSYKKFLKNTFFRPPPVTASEVTKQLSFTCCEKCNFN